MVLTIFLHTKIIYKLHITLCAKFSWYHGRTSKFLTRHCRVCTKKVGRVWYQVKNDNKLLQFLVWTLAMMKDIHPQCFCNSCYLTWRRMYSKNGKGSKSTTTIQPYTWMEHNKNGCEVGDWKNHLLGGAVPVLSRNMCGLVQVNQHKKQ